MTYYWSYNNEEWNEGGNTIQEALNDVRDNEEGETFAYIGKMKCHVPALDGDDIIEALINRAYDDYGDCSEGWLEGNSKALIEELETMLNKSLNKWLDESNQKPTFGEIADVKRYDLGRK